MALKLDKLFFRSNLLRTKELLLIETLKKIHWNEATRKALITLIHKKPNMSILLC